MKKSYLRTVMLSGKAAATRRLKKDSSSRREVIAFCVTFMEWRGCACIGVFSLAPRYSRKQVKCSILFHRGLFIRVDSRVKILIFIDRYTEFSALVAGSS